MRFFVLSNSADTLTGLRLVGIEGQRVHDKKEVRDAINQCITDPGIGVLLINESLAVLCPELIDELKQRSKSTLVVEIPDRFGTGRTPDSITRYIRESIGVKVT